MWVKHDFPIPWDYDWCMYRCAGDLRLAVDIDDTLLHTVLQDSFTNLQACLNLKEMVLEGVRRHLGGRSVSEWESLKLGVEYQVRNEFRFFGMIEGGFAEI